MKRYLPFLIVLVVALATVGTGLALYRSHRLPTPTAAKDSTDLGLHVRGDAKALVTLEEFGDFECPPCAAMAVALHQLEKDYHGKVRLIFRHFPLANHPHARAAAQAAEAAHLQGKFWEMHDLLYERQNDWKKEFDVRPIFERYAKEIGIDVERYKRDVGGDLVAQRIFQDGKRGHSLGVKGTPTVFMNGREVPFENLAADQLRVVIQKELQAAGSSK